MPPGRTRRRYVAGVATFIALTVPTAAPAVAAEIHATPATFGSAFASAGAGDTIFLAAGDYGTFGGGTKPGEVIIRPEPEATATMQLNFNPAANLTFDGLRFGDIEIWNENSRNITVRNSTITGQTVFRTGYLRNANILFDRNVHPAWDKCDGCGEGRVWLPQKRAEPSGITIENSRFGPGGDSDGIQNGSNGTRILNNEFVGIKQIDGGRAHADSIQLYGSSNTVIRGNYFHDDDVHIMAPDGGQGEIIEDNVFDGAGYVPSVQLGSHTGTVFAHTPPATSPCTWIPRAASPPAATASCATTSWSTRASTSTTARAARAAPSPTTSSTADRARAPTPSSPNPPSPAATTPPPSPAGHSPPAPPARATPPTAPTAASASASPTTDPRALRAIRVTRSSPPAPVIPRSRPARRAPGSRRCPASRPGTASRSCTRRPQQRDPGCGSCPADAPSAGTGGSACASARSPPAPWS